MIVAERKPLEEIMGMLTSYERVLILGCGTCVTVCNVGGEREVSLLSSSLRLVQARGFLGGKVFSEYTVKRQCDKEFLDVLKDRVHDIDAVLSLGCGVGVQVVADYLPGLAILPGVNTVFMGAFSESGTWDERCAGCGDCVLAETAGICPITRCAKGIMNGPCGGAKKGKCEADAQTDCAWIMIYKRLEAQGELERMRRFYPPRNFRVLPRPRRLAGR